MAKLFASDYDGTVRHPDLSERTRDAIRRFRVQGGIFGIVTGRGAHAARPIFDEVDVDFISCCNGTMLLFPDGRQMSYGQYSADIARELWTLVLSLGALGFGAQAGDEALWIRTDDAEAAERLGSFLAENRTVSQCHTLFDGYELAEHAAQVIAVRFGDTVNPLQNGHSVDLPPCGIDKAFGVRRAAEYFDIAGDMIYAAGNEMNDYSMVSAFHGFAMSGSPGELTAAAERVIGDVADALEAE